ncbi:uncharacterized protein LOC126977314 [Leptidea sinapis]|uniref:Uncharacterized protein n=1 Tax=Leptidea sinapis TaxID=189913 RepID=A0A5E4QU10_9NEOP|nr:uncharacterized protein LOC126977314 [Leptidea sinapis]VVD00430.1 unnamed protein product [Leptidea sinapis]
MSDEDDLNASIAHILLCCVAGNGLGRTHPKSFTHPGMHANFFIHGVVGFLHFQSTKFNNDFKGAYRISLAASRYLALPCLNADIHRNDQNMSAIHLVSGLIPFALALAGSDNPHLGNLCIACNIVSLCVYSHEHNRTWGWYTAGTGVLAYFITTAVAKKVSYPLCLALMDYCACQLFSVHFSGPGGI